MTAVHMVFISLEPWLCRNALPSTRVSLDDTFPFAHVVKVFENAGVVFLEVESISIQMGDVWIECNVSQGDVVPHQERATFGCEKLFPARKLVHDLLFHDWDRYRIDRQLG